MNPRDLEKERLSILEEMGSITRMRRGTVNVQNFPSRHGDGSTNGPYHLYSRTEKGRSFSQRLSKEAAERFLKETELRRRFKELSDRYILVCEQLADQEFSGKKNSNQPSRRRSATKSSGS
jgi:hypothetical protein